MICRSVLIYILLVLNVSAMAEERSVSPGRYEIMAELMAFPDELPHFALFSKDGKCVFQKSIQLGWSAEELASPDDVSSTAECIRFLTDAPGSAQPKPQSHWQIHLWTLDVPSCLACEHAESELRQLVERFPDRFEMTIQRVVLTSE